MPFLDTKKPAFQRANLFVLNWLRGQDLNLRPLGYEGDFSDEPDSTLSSNTNIFNDFAQLRSCWFGVGWAGF
jgi:hypothetical protein